MTKKTAGDLYDYCCLQYRNKEAIVFDKERFRFYELKEKSTRFANSLLEIGMKKGDKIAVFMMNCPEVIITEYSCYKVGLVRIPIAIYLQIQDIKNILEESEAKAIIYDSKFAHYVDQFRQSLTNIKYFIQHTSNNATISEGEYEMQKMISDGRFVDVQCKINENDIAIINYTGGTTGVPKGIIHSHKTRVNTVLMELLDFDIGYNEVYLAAGPLTHATGGLALPYFLRGGCCVILKGFDSRQVLKTIEEERCTSSFLVPTMIYALLDDTEIEKYDTGSLRNILYGAAPIAPKRLKEAIRVFGPVFTQIYGQSEAPMALTTLHRQEHLIDKDQKGLPRLSSCGRPTLLTNVKLIDEEGNEVSRGQAGEIIVKSPNIMVGYLNRPDLTAETIRDGYLHTGDIALQDDDGYLYIVDRKKDMIVSGGFNIYPGEIERVLSEHPAVSMTAVIGIPDIKWGEAVKAVVVVKRGQSVSEENLMRLCKERKGSVLTPKSIDFVDSIPLTPLGKPDKKALREKYWSRQERRVG